MQQNPMTITYWVTGADVMVNPPGRLRFAGTLTDIPTFHEYGEAMVSVKVGTTVQLIPGWQIFLVGKGKR